jgi:hypothetical protein
VFLVKRRRRREGAIEELDTVNLAAEPARSSRSRSPTPPPMSTSAATCPVRNPGCAAAAITGSRALGIEAAQEEAHKVEVVDRDEGRDEPTRRSVPLASLTCFAGHCAVAESHGENHGTCRRGGLGPRGTDHADRSTRP